MHRFPPEADVRKTPPRLRIHRAFDLAATRCPLLAIPTAIMYAVQENQGTGMFIPRITGCAILLLAFVVASRRVLPLAMQRLVLKDKKKVMVLAAHLFGLVKNVPVVCKQGGRGVDADVVVVVVGGVGVGVGVEIGAGALLVLLISVVVLLLLLGRNRFCYTCTVSPYRPRLLQCSYSFVCCQYFLSHDRL